MSNAINGRFPPQKGDKWKRTRDYVSMRGTVTSPAGKEYVFTGQVSPGGVYFVENRINPSSGFRADKFTDGTLEFVSLGEDTGPRFPPGKGDVWEGNERSPGVIYGLCSVGAKYIFTGESKPNLDRTGLVYLATSVDDKSFTSHSFGLHNFDPKVGGLNFVRRGYPPGFTITLRTKRPHTCTRCGSEALVMAMTVECVNRACACYVAD